MDITRKLREMGYGPASPAIYGLINKWKSWYNGNVKDFHTYSVWNGTTMQDCHRYSVGMAKKVCEDWADLLLNEKVKITLEGEAEQTFVDEVLEANNFRVKGNEMQEKKAALGTAAYVLRVAGAELNEATGEIKGAGQLKIDYCTAPHIHPLSWENGRVIECAFSSTMTIKGEEHTYLQIHKIVNGKYDIENRMFKGNDEIPLATVAGYENVPPVIHTGRADRQFEIDRLNIANVEDNAPMGISVFAHAIDQLKGVDIAYDSYVNEFVLGKKRVMVKPSAAKNLDGTPVFDVNDTIFYVLPEDMEDGTLVEQVDMTLRTQEHNAGIQDMLNVLSSKCGFGENHYKYDKGYVATATQVISENSSMFRTLKKHELILEDVLTSLCRSIIKMGNAYMGLSLDEDVEISIDFDDSVIEDKGGEFNRDLQMLNAGILNDWEFRAKWLNEDVETAKAALPKMEDITEPLQFEVE